MASGRVDLHMHSTASDGALTPSELLARAHANGVSMVALTDHDTTAGLTEARCAADKLGISLVDGIELSCVWNGMTLHVLGLGIEPASEAMTKAVATQQQNRQERSEVIAIKLQKAGLGNVLPELTQQLAGKVAGRPDFARFLVEKGLVASMQQAFDRYLGAGKVGDVKQFWPSLEEITCWITEAGGIPVLAHPLKYKITAAKLRRLVQDFKNLGGQGLEVAMPNLDSGRLDMLAQMCRLHDLYASCGSDFHEPGRPWQDIGCYANMPERLKPVWSLWQH